jgi:uncharacterized membrane protein
VGRAFVRDGTTGAYSSFSFPGAIFTQALGINNAGSIVGLYIDSKNQYHGFLKTGDSFTSIDVYGASYTDAWKINDSGQIVGRYGSPDQGYLYSAGSFSAVMPQHFAWAYGINNSGNIVGLYVDTNGDHGFVKVGNTFIPIDYPGNTGVTAAYDINNYGSIVGWYTDPTAGERGFLATPVPLPGDFGPADCDVDGSDLAVLIANTSLMDLTTFAENFGENDCP